MASTRILIGLTALGGGALYASEAGIIGGGGDTENTNSEQIMSSPGASGSPGPGGAPGLGAKKSANRGTEINVEAPEFKPMSTASMPEKSNVKKKETSDSGGSSGGSITAQDQIEASNKARRKIENDRKQSVQGGGFSTVTEDGKPASGFATAPDSDGNQETAVVEIDESGSSSKKESTSSGGKIPASGPGSEYANNIEDGGSSSKKERKSSESDSGGGGLLDNVGDSIGGLF